MQHTMPAVHTPVAEDLLTEIRSLAQVLWLDATALDWSPSFMGEPEVVGLRVDGTSVVPVEFAARCRDFPNWQWEKTFRGRLLEAIDLLDDSGYDFEAAGSCWNRVTL